MTLATSLAAKGVNYAGKKFYKFDAWYKPYL
jgi:hypothetical protein